jgi:aminomethyltransferase
MTNEVSLRRTPLFAAHQKLGARLIDFGGWEMPLQYTGIIDEHQAVRTAAGVFDISHMGEVLVRGPNAESFLNQTLTNDLRKIHVSQGQYTLMCNERGGVIDDLYAYRIGSFEFLLVVNASRIEPDLAWLRQQHGGFARHGEVELENASNGLGALALQGPQVKEFIDGCFPRRQASDSVAACASSLKKNDLDLFEFDGSMIHVARTGYTGEDGFEIIAAAQIIEAVWNRILAVGRPFGLKPCGLGARDTLRTEMCYPLYGHELDENTTPIEAGLGFFVALDKGNFIGRPVLAGQKEKGPGKKCVAFKMTGKSAPPRPQYPIWTTGDGAQPIGVVVSGTQSPSLGIGIGLGYVPPQFAKPGAALDVEIRGHRSPAVVVQKPIYRKPASG